MKYFTGLLDSIKRRDFAPVYLFHGPEAYLRRLALEKITEALLGEGNEELNLISLDGEKASAREVVSMAETAPFFSDFRLIIVDRPVQFRGSPGKDRGEADMDPEDNEENTKAEKKVSKKDGEDEPLTQYIASPMPTSCVVFNSPDPVDKRKKIYKAVEKYGRVVEFALLKPADIRRWLDKQAHLAGKKIESQAADALLARVGRDLTALHSEMEKLIDHAGEGPVITLDEVKTLTAVPLEESIFSVVDAIGEKNPGKAVSGLKDLLLGRENPQKILSMVARQFRLLLQIKEALAGGCPFADLAGATGMHPFVVKKIYQQAKGFETGQLIHAIHILHKIDKDVKGGRLDFTAAMEMFIVETVIATNAV
ncbi:MAG: hypothetical protein VR69_02200 [Peptococcaceae bacterium BRH_c4b]|nr:MAG: hypothetical protein VR69_02200 [Peptococcaceae bacterium BRH_c4b]